MSGNFYTISAIFTLHIVILFSSLMYVEYLRRHVSFKNKWIMKYTLLKVLFVWAFIPMLNYPLGLVMVSHSFLLMVDLITKSIKSSWSKLEVKD